ncbi:MAG: hypothetical protein RRY79_02145 [Clostridia bacterium]
MKKTLMLWVLLLTAILLVGCGTKHSTPLESAKPTASSEISGAQTPIVTNEPKPVVTNEPTSSANTEIKPIEASQVASGTYTITVTSSSSMFRIVDAKLTVKDGKMSAILTLSGKGYSKLYIGTGAEALVEKEDQFIPFVENAEGKYTYEVPVAYLNKEINCAAWSSKKEEWYDRVLIFRSEGIPVDAIKAK